MKSGNRHRFDERHRPWHCPRARANRLQREVQEHVKAAAAKEGEEGKKVAQEMAEFLKHWLIDHVIEEDLRMKPFIRSHKGL